MPKSRTKRNQTTGRSRGRSSTNHIPQFQANVRMKHRFRFSQTLASAGYAINRGNLLNLMIVGAVAANSGYRLFNGIKLNKIEIWSPTTAVAAPQTIALEWLSNYGPTSEISDTGNAFNWAHIVSSPPRTSLAGFWSMTGMNESESLFSIQVPQGAIVDIWVDIVFNDGVGLLNTTYATNPTAGILFYGTLTGIGSQGLTPVTVTPIY